MIHKILTLFLNTLTVDEKHYLLNRDNLTQPIQMQLYKKQKSFAEFFFFHFSNLYYILTIRQKRMTLIDDGFTEILSPKNMVS